MGTVNAKQKPKNVISLVSTIPRENIAKNALKDTLESRSMVGNVKVIFSTFIFTLLFYQEFSGKS